jgi:hypothetical protein
MYIMNMFISPTKFIYKDTLYIKSGNGRYSKVVRDNLFVRKRISLAQYETCLAACRQDTEITDVPPQPAKEEHIALEVTPFTPAGRKPLLRYPPGKAPLHGRNRRWV